MMERERYSIERLNKELLKLTPKEKRRELKRLLQIYHGWKYNEGKDYTGQIYENDVYEEMNRQLDELESNTSPYYNHDLNYYFNSEIIPNQDAVFATKQFVENKRKDLFKPLDFFNLLFKQIDLLKDNVDTPIDYLNSLKALPYSEEQLHLLLGMIIYWHGGNTDNQLNPKYKTILKLIEDDFLAMFPNTVTEEKKFYDNKSYNKLLKEKELIINQTLSKQYDIKGSKYLKRMDIDFQELPQYIIEKGIITYFEERIFYSDTDYISWEKSFLKFLSTIPEEYIQKTVAKGIEFAKKAYTVHLEFDCPDKGKCVFNESWERRISMTEHIMNSINKAVKSKEDVPESTIVLEEDLDNQSKKTEFTTARQVLAVHYLLEYCKINNIDNTIKARFVQFLTGKEVGVQKIQNTTIYKKVRSPFSLNDKTLVADLQYIRAHFENLGLVEIASAITKEINTKAE